MTAPTEPLATRLARIVQDHALRDAGATWGPTGQAPNAIEISFDGNDGDRAWHVKFATKVNAGHRVMAVVSGPTVEEALRRAMVRQGFDTDQLDEAVR